MPKFSGEVSKENLEQLRQQLLDEADASSSDDSAPGRSLTRLAWRVISDEDALRAYAEASRPDEDSNS